MKTVNTPQMGVKTIQGAGFYPAPNPDGSATPFWLPRYSEWAEMLHKGALVPWAAKQEKTGILRQLSAWVSERPELSHGSLMAELKRIEGAKLCYQNVSQEALDIGTSAHKWLHWHLLGLAGVPRKAEPILLPGAEIAVEAAMRWLASVHVEPITVEERLVSYKHGYAGTCDLVAELDWKGDDGKVSRRTCIVDWKTSKAIYWDMEIQNHAYRMAHAEMHNGNGVLTKGGVIVRIAKTADDPMPFEARQVPYKPHLSEAFLGLGAAWRAMRIEEGKFIGGVYA